MCFFDLSSNIINSRVFCFFQSHLKNKKRNNLDLILLFNKRNQYPIFDFYKSNKFSEIQLITIDIASPKKIKEWAEKKLLNGKIFGQVTNPNTLHYKTLKPLKGGLFCERIFGPIKDFECACGIHKQKPFHKIINFQNKQFCPKCDVEYTWSDIRRYQLGYIELVTPITHIWYLKGMPSYIRSVLGAKKKYIEGITYCSDIVTIDKAWKPNRLIPFPEQFARFYSKNKKKINNTNNTEKKVLNYKTIEKDINYYYNIKNQQYLNKKYIKETFFSKLIQNQNLKQIEMSNNFFQDSNFNLITTNSIKKTKFFNVNPFFYNIEYCSYKSKIIFYKTVCRFFINRLFDNKSSIYVFKILDEALCNSKIFFDYYEKKYSIDKKKLSNNLFIDGFINLNRFKKLKKNKKQLSFISSKKIYIQKKFLFFKIEKVTNFKIFTNCKLLTKISNNNNNDRVPEKKHENKKFYLKNPCFILKMDFLNKIVKMNNYNNVLNNFVLLDLNYFSFNWFKNNVLFISFYKLLNFMQLKIKRYDLFAVFVFSGPKILPTFFLKSYIQSNIVLDIEKKPNNLSKLIRTFDAKTKRKVFLQNFSIYDEGIEILWHKFWKSFYFSSSIQVMKNLRKIIKKSTINSCSFVFSSLTIIKKIVKKLNIDRIFYRHNFESFLQIKKKLHKITKNKFSLFINLMKIYFKKIMLIYHLIIKNKENTISSNFLVSFFTYFKKRIKKKLVKLLTLELLVWRLSQFAFNWFDKPVVSNAFFNFNQKISFFKLNRKQNNYINKIQKNSFSQYLRLEENNNTKILPKKIVLKDYFSSFFESFSLFKEELSIYKNEIHFFLKNKKFKFFLKSLFFKNLKNNFSFFKNRFFINSKFQKINLKKIHNITFLFYQKQWLLKKKQIFSNYFLLKNYKYTNLHLYYFNHVVKLIYSSFLKNDLLINIFSIKLKQFCYFNLIKKQKKFYSSKSFKKVTYFYSFLFFCADIIKKFQFFLFNFNNTKFFFNLFCFFKFAKKNFFKNFNWFIKVKTFFYSFKIFTYQQTLQKKLMVKFAKKYKFFQNFNSLIDSVLFYYTGKLKIINKTNLIKLIKKKKFPILNYLKKLQSKLLNQIQKNYFFKFQIKKFIELDIYIKSFKNNLIGINIQKKKIKLNTKKVSNLLFFDSELINLNFKKFFYTSHYWEVILNLSTKRIGRKYLLLPFSLYFLHSINIKSLKFNFFLRSLRQHSSDVLYFNFFRKNTVFNNFTSVDSISNGFNKKQILQTRKKYLRMLKFNNLFFIKYFKNIWNGYLIKKNGKIFSNLLFFFFSYQQISQKNNIELKEKNSFKDFYLKFLKHDLNKNFNESIFSVISESQIGDNVARIWNNIYSLSNRYCWKSDLALNIFLGYMLSPENPSDILIPFYKKRVHNSNVLREEPPIAGGAVIFKFLEEYDLVEMKKIDIQLQTILKKLPNKLNEIEILLKHYQTNVKFLKYYSIKKRSLIDIEKSILRKLKYIRRLHWVSAKPEFMIIRNLPVLPADLRPIFKIQQQLTASDLNRLYQKVMYRNDRLKRFLKSSTTSNSFEMLFAQRMLQEAVDNLIENGKDGNSIELDSRGRALKSLGELLKGKKGRFRQNLLGKRVDYSGRSVIVVGPKLKLHECGLPVEMAIELFLPFLIKEILKNKYSLTVRSAKFYIKTHRVQITQLLRQIVKNQPILLNRAPTLHRLGIQAFLPTLVEGKAILLHPLVCSAFNADFDGDQMAVHVPITNEARIEAWKLVLSRNNLLSPATGEPILLPSQDMVLGCYYLTIQYFQSFRQKQRNSSKKLENQSSFIYSNFDTIFNAYQQNEIHLHTNIWIRYNNYLESDSIYQEPKELQIYSCGQYIKIYSEYYQKFSRNGKIYNQIIKTTTGRVLFNLLINDCFN